jgi:hypothetical protein
MIVNFDQLTGFAGVFGIRIDFNEKSILFAEEIVQIQEHLSG